MSTIGKALTAYLRSADYKSKAASVQTEYRRVAMHLAREIGHVEFDSVNRSWLRGMRDEWAQAGHRAATIRLQVLKNALSPAMSDGELPAALFNQLQRVDAPHGRPEQNVVWTDEEVDAVLDYCLLKGETCAGKAQVGLARAVALARYAGLRRQDVCNITEEARYTVTLRGGHKQKRIRYFSSKGEQKADLREDPRLSQILDDDSFGCGDTIAFNIYGVPWIPRQLNQALDRVVERLASQGLIRRGLTLHGLRHTRGVELAYAGASDAELMAQLAHADEQSARVYRRQAQRSAMGDHAQRLVDQKRLRDARNSASDSLRAEPIEPVDQKRRDARGSGSDHAWTAPIESVAPTASSDAVDAQTSVGIAQTAGEPETRLAMIQRRFEEMLKDYQGPLPEESSQMEHVHRMVAKKLEP